MAHTTHSPAGADGAADALVSIVVPVYGVEAWLDACVASVLAQTHRRLEVLLVDDGSPDRCGQMCDAWAKRDPRVRALHKPNGGLSDARNYGLSRATGEWVLFVDSDDELAPGCLEACLAAARESGAECVRFRYQAVDEDGQNVPSPYGEENDIPHGTVSGLRACRALLRTQFENFFCCLACRRDLLDRIGFCFPVGVKFEDMAVIYKVLLAADHVSFLPNRLYRYRMRGDSILHEMAIGGLLDKWTAVRDRQDYIDANVPQLHDVCLAKTYSEMPGLYVNFLYYREEAERREVSRREIRERIDTADVARLEGLTPANRALLRLIYSGAMDAMGPLVRWARGNKAISDAVLGTM